MILMTIIITHNGNIYKQRPAAAPGSDRDQTQHYNVYLLHVYTYIHIQMYNTMFNL